MRSSLRFIVGIIGLLGLLALGTACGDLPTAGPAYPGPETEGPAPIALTSPLPIVQPPPYPQPTEPPPTRTLPPERPPTLTPIPTATPPPTALPQPLPDFNILWVESVSGDVPGGPRGVIWLADPRDIANRQEVTRFDDQEIYHAALSPNGRQIAFTAAGEGWRDSPLWVVNPDGTGLRQIAPDAGQILWGQNNRTIYYSLWAEGRVSIERVDLASGESQRILTIEQEDPVLEPLGWSAGGQWLYHVRQNPETRDFELWKVQQDGSTSQFITSLGANLPGILSLSPEGGKLLVGIWGNLRWVATDGQGEGNIPLFRLDRAYEALWGRGENEVLVGQPDASDAQFHLYTINIPSLQTRELATFAGASWGLFSLSPDRHWLMASLWGSGFYWIHLPSGTMVPVPCQCRIDVVGWVPRGTGR